MTFDEVVEWLEAIHEAHRSCAWFADKGGMIFTFLWYEDIKAGVNGVTPWTQ